MCLDTVDEVTKKSKGYGYKVFEKDLIGKLHPWYAGREYITWEEEEWLTAEPIPNFGNREPQYNPLFHIITHRRGCKPFLGGATIQGRTEIIRKVKYEEVVASGQETGQQVIVARKMYILKGKV